MLSFLRRIGTEVLLHWAAVSIFLIVLAIGAALAYWLVPNKLVIAVGDSDLDEPRIVQLLVDTLAKDNAHVRLTVLRTTGATQSAQALAKGQAQLAVVRSDQTLVAGASSIASLHRFFPVVFTKPENRIKKLTDLKGKKIGIRGEDETNIKLAIQLLAHVGLQENDYQLVRMQRGEQANNARLGLIDAYFGVSSDNLKTRSSLNDTLSQAWGNKMVVLAFEDATVLAQRIRGVEEGKIPKGFYGGAPAKPNEDMDSIMLSNRIVAGEKISPSTAVTLTKALISLRDKRQADTPEVLSIQEPARNVPTLPVHPGTLQLIEGLYQPWLDRYINHIFVGLATMGALGSILTTLTSRRRRESRDQSINDVHALLGLRDHISHSKSPEMVSKHLAEVNRIFQDALIARAEGHISPGSLSLIESAVAYCQHAAENKLRANEANPARKPLAQALQRRLKLLTRMQPAHRR